MKAIIRGSAGLVCLLLLGSVSNGYVWVSPVFKTPLPYAPDCYGPGMYSPGPQGMWYGPSYYVVPPFQPFNGMLPGPTGQAIMSGYLPHKLLLSKEGMDIGKVPLLGEKKKGDGEAPYPSPGTQGPQGPSAGPGQYPMAPRAYPPMPYGGMPNMGMAPRMPYGAMPYQGMAPQMPYGAMPNMGMAPQMPYGAMPYQGMGPQMPYGGMPYQGMPPPAPYPGIPHMPHPGQTPMAPQQPIGYLPYNGTAAMYVTARQDPMTGIWLVQGPGPNQGPTPFIPPQPNPALQPMPNAGPGFQFFGPMDPLNRLGPLQMPQQPRMNMAPLQAPQMELAPPPPQKAGGNAFPSHLFMRSPRDFFMWTEYQEEEKARSNRPFPVP